MHNYAYSLQELKLSHCKQCVQLPINNELNVMVGKVIMTWAFVYLIRSLCHTYNQVDG